MGRWIFRGLAILLLSAGLVGGIILIGKLGIENLRGQDRYLFPMNDIDCKVPPGMTRTEFIEEVQYQAGLPDRLALLEEDLPAKLTQAFAQHPWVERVGEVKLNPGQVRVDLQFRKPVLAVLFENGWRVVDGNGILLPRNAPTVGLPTYEKAVLKPKGLAGTKWGDPGVETRAQALQK